MEWIFGLGAAGFLILTCIIMPWVNRSRIQDVNDELTVVKKQLRDLFAFLEKSAIQVPHEIAAPQKIWQWQLAQQAEEVAPAVPAEKLISEKAALQNDAPNHVSFEQQFGARLPVWIGGIALALAGFFMVKYSIETGLLSPTVRVILGSIFGLGLLASAEKIRENAGFSNGPRIAQALSGAGIADLYVCLFAATSLYDLLPSLVGFIGMAGVTAMAMILALRHGMPIAILGLVGGLLTPALVSSHEPDAPLLFIYLYAVTAGLMVVIRQKTWWGIAVPTMLGAFAWVSIWLTSSYFSPFDALWLGLFLLATSATYVFLSPRDEEKPTKDGFFTLHKMLNYLTLGGAAIMMAFVVGQSGYTMMAWGLFGLLALGAVGLAYADQARYGFAPWLAMGINLLMLAGWHQSDLNLYGLVATAFAAIFIINGYLLQSRSERPLPWSGLVIASTLAYYLLGYAKMHHAVPENEISLLTDIPYFWGTLAAIIAAFSVLTLRRLMVDIPNDHPQKAHVLSIYAAQATAFITLALTIELEREREFLSVAVALQVLGLAWITTRVDIQRLREIAAVVAVVFGVLLIPQILLLIQLTAYSLVEAQLRLQEGIPMVNWPIFQLGVPAIAFLGASYLLRRERDDRIVRALEVSAIALVATMGYYLTRHAFHVSSDVLFVKAGFIERGVITNILFVYGLVCLFLGQRYCRSIVSLSGLVLSGVAMFRLGYFDLLAYNPIWATQKVGELPILNALLLTYGAPLVWMALLLRDMRRLAYTGWTNYVAAFLLLVAFTLISLEVRQLFHGAVLNDTIATNAEVYCYSVAWLIFGLTLLFYGTYRTDKMVRVASLVVMIFTVGKVFLYDASELEGLFRVCSFAGLGLSLLGLSWFYTRFVFGDRKLFGVSR